MLEEGKESKPSLFLTTRRIAWTMVGILGFLWIGYEDRGLTPILILSALIATALGLEVYLRGRNRRYAVEALQYLRGAGIGVMSGALVGPVSLLLASIKTSLHQHEPSDFRVDDLTMLVERIPFWALAGLLMGTAVSILEWSTRSKS